jgi:ketosteroid isomerase-like protein
VGNHGIDGVRAQAQQAACRVVRPRAACLRSVRPAKGCNMRKAALLIITAAASSLLVATPAAAAPADDATAFVTNIMDKFNGGDAKAFLNAHQDSALIVDEFGAHVWTGSGSAKHWLDDYAKDSTARGITGGRVDYGLPIQANSDGTSAYVVLPTTYRFLQKGTKMAAVGSMTFVVTRSGDNWKIASWTYSGATAAPEK